MVTSYFDSLTPAGVCWWHSIWCNGELIRREPTKQNTSTGYSATNDNVFKKYLVQEI